jgi:hypothetical protein
LGAERSVRVLVPEHSLVNQVSHEQVTLPYSVAALIFDTELRIAWTNEAAGRLGGVLRESEPTGQVDDRQGLVAPVEQQRRWPSARRGASTSRRLGSGPA